MAPTARELTFGMVLQNDGGMLPSSTTYTGGLGSVVGSHGGHHVRRSLPDMGTTPSEPPKLYPYHLLVITNYRLPADVDRCNLEVSNRDILTIVAESRTRYNLFRTPGITFQSPSRGFCFHFAKNSQNRSTGENRSWMTRSMKQLSCKRKILHVLTTNPRAFLSATPFRRGIRGSSTIFPCRVLQTTAVAP